MKKRFKKWMRMVLAVALLLGTMLVPSNRAEAAGETLLNTYGSLFGYSGTCISLNQLRNADVLAHVKTQYNSITLENEMKPDAMLGYSPSLISRDEAKGLGYYIPASMTETYVPRINFSTLDEVLKICKDNGLKMRAHTLVWHSQTPDWFFRTGYSANYGYVSQAQMDLRMEYYIKSVMNHVYSGQYGDVVYAWDVVNEYQHAQNSGWLSIYGNVNNYPSFVKKAFQYAHDCLEYYGLSNSVSLFYNDFNTYMEVNDIITMIDFINADGKICDGVGMQSHLGTTFPSVSYYTDALKAFLNAGFEVQITELDIVNKGDVDQANYVYDLMTNILALKKNGGNITGITIWGLSDDVTWIRGEKPLFFSTLGNAKYSYTRMIEAYKNAGFSVGGGSTGGGGGGSTDVGSDNRIQCESMTKSGTFTGNINSPFDGVALYANNDAVSFSKYFAYDTHDFTLRGASNGSNMARVDLVINGETKGTFYFGDQYPAEYTVKGVTHPTGAIDIKLVVSADDGTWDAYLDYLAIGSASGSSDTGNAGNNTTNNDTGLSNGWYYIKNTNAQKYLQAADNAAGDGVSVGIGTGAAGQKWYLTNLSNGYVTLKNGHGYMLDVQYGAKDDGTNIQICAANNADAQMFKLMPTSTSGVFGIATKVTDAQKALDVYEWRTSDGANVCQWAYYGAENQTWRFEACN